MDASEHGGIELTVAFAVPGRGLRAIAVAIELAIAAAALPAGAGLVRDGLGMPTAWIRHSLFPDYALPGLLLIVLIGGGMLAAALATALRAELTAPAALLAGGLQLAWLLVETCVLGWHGGAQPALLALVGALALALLASGWHLTTLRRAPSPHAAGPLRAQAAAAAGSMFALRRNTLSGSKRRLSSRSRGRLTP
jgi:hypothetical protein